MYYNLILDKLPNVTPHGSRIRTDFRESIKFELLMQNDKISETDKVKLAVNLYYYDANTKNEKELKNRIEDMLWFYRCGKEEQKEKDRSKCNKRKL